VLGTLRGNISSQVILPQSSPRRISSHPRACSSQPPGRYAERLCAFVECEVLAADDSGGEAQHDEHGAGADGGRQQARPNARAQLLRARSKTASGRLFKQS